MNLDRPKILIMRDKGRITIPFELRRTYGLDEGSHLYLCVEHDHLVLYPHHLPANMQFDDETEASPRNEEVTAGEL